MKKVSVDYDGTLDREDVQAYIRELIARGVIVWVCTARLSPKNAHNSQWNDAMFKVTDGLGIPREHIIFTNYEKDWKNKSEFLKGKGFTWHLDDDNIELSFIKTDTEIKPIYLFANPDWKRDCENELIEKL
jgi:hypothetical protein